MDGHDFDGWPAGDPLGGEEPFEVPGADPFGGLGEGQFDLPPLDDDPHGLGFDPAAAEPDTADLADFGGSAELAEPADGALAEPADGAEAAQGAGDSDHPGGLDDGALAEPGDGPLIPPAAVVGADPDRLDWFDDEAWSAAFPPPLALADPPSPVDGLPWSDPEMLGFGLSDLGERPDLELAGVGQLAWEVPTPQELGAADGVWPAGSDGGWGALLGSEDPATSCLARWWSVPR